IARIENAAGQVVYQAAPKEVCEQCPQPADNGTPQVDAQGHLVPTVTTTGTGGANPANAPAPPATPPAAAPAAAAPAADAAASPGDPDHRPANALAPLLPADRVAPRVISPQNDWIMDDMMADVIKRGTGIRAGLALKRGDISGKTGTTNEARDTWFNGFNRNIVATVWVGFDQERPLGEGEEGSRTAVPIWVNFMREALRDQPVVPRPMPGGLVTARISPRTGELAAPNEGDAIEETFMEDHMPTATNAIDTFPGTQVPNPGGVGSEPLF
ncbi:MAG TPA: penicillin-binding transpeptidase domain-containing protein, partial [Steroidobacteraceae bacterium]